MTDPSRSRERVPLLTSGATAAGFFLVLACLPAAAQFVAFNDYAPGGGTHTNATTYGPGASGRLKDIATGAPAAANVLVYSSAIRYGPLQGSPRLRHAGLHHVR